jgi:hypothetical protein
MKALLLSATAAVTLVGAVVVAAPASAAPIVVNNFSFETLPPGGLPFGCGGSCAYSVGAIPDWSNSGSSGQWITGGYLGNPSAFEGDVLAYTNDNPISQDVGTAILGATYTLQVEILHRTDVAFGGVAQIEIGGNVVATATGVDGGPGTWSNWTAVYTATASDAGKTLTILLSTNGSGQADFDDVRLDATGVPAPIPEPASMALLGLGLLGLGMVRRHRAA